MNTEQMISMLEDKDTSEAYKALQELERISDDSDILYPYLDKFTEMIMSEKYVIRVRGFRLYCKQAKWDTDNKIDETIDMALNILKDPKPTAVRQALAALLDLVPDKADLRDIVKERVSAIDYFRYKDTMHSLIAKDMQAVLALISRPDK